MKVRELIELLQAQDAEADVYIETPTHDHWRNWKVEPITVCEPIKSSWSDYHNSLIIDENGAGKCRQMQVTISARERIE